MNIPQGVLRAENIPYVLLQARNSPWQALFQAKNVLIEGVTRKELNEHEAQAGNSASKEYPQKKLYKERDLDEHEAHHLASPLVVSIALSVLRCSSNTSYISSPIFHR